jgi:hypothetical protein
MGLTIKRAERDVAVCLDGTLVAQYEALDRESKQVQMDANADPRLNSPHTKRLEDIKAEIADLAEKQRQETVTFTLRALPRDVWEQLVSEHPAREDNDTDEQYGFNTDTLYSAALAYTDPSRPEVRTIVKVADHDGKSVEFTPADWPTFAADLSTSQQNDFVVQVAVLNVGENTVSTVPSEWKRTRPTAVKSK